MKKTFEQIETLSKYCPNFKPFVTFSLTYGFSNMNLKAHILHEILFNYLDFETFFFFFNGKKGKKLHFLFQERVYCKWVVRRYRWQYMIFTRIGASSRGFFINMSFTPQWKQSRRIAHVAYCEYEKKKIEKTKTEPSKISCTNSSYWRGRGIKPLQFSII